MENTRLGETRLRGKRLTSCRALLTHLFLSLGQVAANAARGPILRARWGCRTPGRQGDASPCRRHQCFREAREDIAYV